MLLANNLWILAKWGEDPLDFQVLRFDLVRLIGAIFDFNPLSTFVSKYSVIKTTYCREESTIVQIMLVLSEWV